ncbi:class I SAM-dependent methyltransferase [Almyronema epifaneia]|uniref:Class I SAM-dependent methyltransferase n=1 Tax=Almyronema epifaneia S1 TaxID=2991925 RepID=A0ABW6IBD0_9CYAN
MADFERSPKAYYSQTLNQKKTWYAAVAAAYDKARPPYPPALIQQALALAQLSAGDRILELGCGPATATTAFAALGMTMVCLEPSPPTYALAQQNCAPYPAVSLLNTTFEEWSVDSAGFEAVLAANAFHWIAPDIRHAKSAQALKAQGALILLWNLPPQLPSAIGQQLQPIYQAHSPELAFPESFQARVENIRQLGQAAVHSGYFQHLKAEQQICQAFYSVDDYLLLLSTLSPYIALPAEQRQALFADLKAALEKSWGDRLPVSYLSALQVLHKADC